MSEKKEKFLTTEEMYKIMISQEQVLTESAKIEVQKANIEAHKLAKIIKELEAKNLAHEIDKRIQKVRDSKDALKTLRDSNDAFSKKLMKKYKIEGGHLGFDDETGRIIEDIEE